MCIQIQSPFRSSKTITGNVYQFEDNTPYCLPEYLNRNFYCSLLTHFSFNETLISFIITTICSYFIEVIVIILIPATYMYIFSHFHYIKTLYYFKSFQKSIEDWEKKGIDRFFSKRHNTSMCHVSAFLVSWCCRVRLFLLQGIL